MPPTGCMRQQQSCKACGTVFSQKDGTPKWWTVFWKSPFEWFPLIFKTDGAQKLFELIVSDAADIIREDSVESEERLGELRKDLEVLKIKVIATGKAIKVQSAVNSRLKEEVQKLEGADSPTKFATGAPFTDASVRDLGAMAPSCTRR